MGMNNEYAAYDPVVFDIETAPLDTAADFLEPAMPDGRLTDEKKIAADIAAKEVDRIGRCSLDYNVGRIVALGMWTGPGCTSAIACKDWQDEAYALRAFWILAKNRTIVGFNCKGFDCRWLIQRSRYLGVPCPQLDLGKYSRKGVIDLYLDLTFNDGIFDKGEMSRSLKSFCRRFGIPVNDVIAGKDIPALVKAGKWDDIISHVTSDVEATVALARKLGVIAPAVETVL